MADSRFDPVRKWRWKPDCATAKAVRLSAHNRPAIGESMDEKRETLPAVSVAIVRGDTVLLVKRARQPSQGFYAFPGGKVEAGETLEQAAARELLEETGMRADAYRPLRKIHIDGR